MNPDGSNKRKLTHFNDPGFPESVRKRERVIVGEMGWNPDGTRLVSSVYYFNKERRSNDDEVHLKILLFTSNGEPTTNNPPVADKLDVSTSQDTQVGITLTGSDVDGCDTTTFTFGVVSESGPTDGTLSGISQGTCNGTGSLAASVTYTPNAGFTGSDSFKFTISDEVDTSTAATVSISVSPATGPTTIGVQSVSITLTRKGQNWDGRATVILVDETGTPLEQATVTGNWDVNGTNIKSGVSGTTNGQGQARINSGKVNANSGELFTFTITDVSKAGFTWDGIQKSGSAQVP